MKIVKILLFAVGLLVLLGIVAFVASGLLIPAERSFINEIEINAPAERVWEVITDRNKYTEWQPNLTRVENIDDRNWIEYPKDSPEPLNFSLSKDERPNRMEFGYRMGDKFNGIWRGEITRSQNGVKLKTVDSYTVKSLPTKVLVYMFFDMDRFAKDWNERLKQRAESSDK
jgi:uncharacterized protein YndB with AHSA1/START domain